MKRAMFIYAALLALCVTAHTQDNTMLQQAVTKLDNAAAIKDYQQLAASFAQIADAQKTQWLPYYYAAFCNAKIGWLSQNNTDIIEGYANMAEQQVRKAENLLDTMKQKAELSEIYCVLSMVYRARVFINPATYGRQYGPGASMYTKMAQQANPDNPRALYLAGWEKFATPKLWGGDKNMAKQLLLAAQQKLAANTPGNTQPHWGKAETDALLAQIK